MIHKETQGISLHCSQTAAILGGVVSVANLGVTADLVNRYGSIGYPSDEIRVALIFSMITAVWGIILAVILPLYYQESTFYGTSMATATFLLLVTFLLDLVS